MSPLQIATAWRRVTVRPGSIGSSVSKNGAGQTAANGVVRTNHLTGAPGFSGWSVKTSVEEASLESCLPRKAIQSPRTPMSSSPPSPSAV